MRKTYLALLLMLFAMGLSYCNKKYKTSKHGTMDSHRTTSECNVCHRPGGPGDGVFYVSGSVLNEARYVTQKKAVVKLYTKPKSQGELVAELYTDDMGNFYTTQKIDFTQGLYPSLYGTPGVKEDNKHMRQPVYVGNCNSCHGQSAEKLGID